MILKIPAKYLRLAQTCQGKNDVRYYLNGILLSTGGDIVSTDGHRLAKTTHDDPEYLAELNRWSEQLDRNIIIEIAEKIPASAEQCTIDTDRMCIHCISAKGRPLKTFVIDTIDGKFPDYRQVLPSSPVEPTTQVGFNPKYLADAAILGSTGFPTVKLELRGEHTALTVYPNNNDWPKDTKMIIMPARL